MRPLLFASAAATLMLITACNKAKSPDAVDKDVAAAQQKAANEVARSEDSASKDLGKAADKVDDKLVDLNNAAAKDAYDIALAKADGDRKVALANCQSASGDAQKTCKDLANAQYDAAKAEAKATAQAQKQ